MSLSPESLFLLQPFADVFSRPTFCHLRTWWMGPCWLQVAAPLQQPYGQWDEAMSVISLGFHRVLNRAVWSPFQLSRILLGLLVMAFLTPDAPLILLIDGTLERRWGRRIA